VAKSGDNWYTIAALQGIRNPSANNWAAVRKIFGPYLPGLKKGQYIYIPAIDGKSSGSKSAPTGINKGNALVQAANSACGTGWTCKLGEAWESTKRWVGLEPPGGCGGKYQPSCANNGINELANLSGKLTGADLLKKCRAGKSSSCVLLAASVVPGGGEVRGATAAAKAAKAADHLFPIGPATEKVWSVLNRVGAKGAPLPGYKGGSVFKNKDGMLPKTPGVTYREWDVNPYTKGVDRGAERLVTGSDGSAYFTSDHYKAFMLVRGPTG
jgi:guanyl-specific ribonuclease Sa